MSGISRSEQTSSAEGTTATARRESLLTDYRAAITRPLDLDRAVAAVKLRAAAEIYCEKNNLARFAPRPPRTSAGDQWLEALVNRPVDELIAEVESTPRKFSRTQLTDVAQRHLLAALNIDIALYKKGLHKAGLYEGLHSVAGRVVSAAAVGVSAGVSEVQGMRKAVTKTVKILSHQLPASVVNPALTGTLRSVTDVKESFKRVGGLPVLASQIDKSPDMGKIASRARDMRKQLDEAVVDFAGSPENDQALGRLVDAFLALHEVVDRQYRRRIGLNRTQTYSKGWGMAVNGVAAVGAVVSTTAPLVGQVAGPAILASTIPLQWGAGYLDERRNKHRYTLRANTKWGDFLKDDAAKIHFKELTAEHVSESKLRQSFLTQPEVQIAAIREVYEDALGQLIRQRAEAHKGIDVQSERELETEIELVKGQADQFESFDMGQWRAIPADSVIGRCLDSLDNLEKANRRARLRKPGEGAQIVQRYVHAFHGGVSTGTTLPVVDAIASIDSFHAHDSHGHDDGLQPAPLGVAGGAGAAGGAVFTGATGEVRMSKADNRKNMAQLRMEREVYEADAEDWGFRAGDRDVDLRTSAGYRQHTQTRWDELMLVAKALKHGLTSGPVGLKNLAVAKMELRQARASLQSALDALAKSGLQRQTPDRARAPTISSMKDQLFDYQAVRLHLNA
ncbi:hypothetical protein [Xanthomonas hortorum]|uniref:Type III effector HopAV1 n=1 Tax=Xanthomonas hortorum TaxID=56454 RepID=A0AA47EW65_9XANT|nr:hypothetical protein [Xanthomonas hortorum]WAH66490.1 hypothetical protein OEG85_11505 [Xanthomonas hortorum]